MERQCGCGKQGQNVTGKEERMRQGFVKVAAVTPKIRIADTGYNAKVICQSVKEATEAGSKSDHSSFPKFTIFKK